MDANIDLYAGEAARERRSKSLFRIAGMNIYDRTGERGAARILGRSSGESGDAGYPDVSRYLCERLIARRNPNPDRGFSNLTHAPRACAGERSPPIRKKKKEQGGRAYNMHSRSVFFF